MSAPDAPEDHSLEIARMQIEEQRRAEAQQRADAEELRQQLSGLRSDAYTGGRSTAQSYLTSMGVDPNNYADVIERELQRIGSTISRDDPNPGVYYGNVGPQIYDVAQTGERSQYQRQLDDIFAPNFETRRIADTIDDPYLSSIEEEQFSSADQIIKNMLARGVITGSGYDAAYNDLNKQRAGVSAQLTALGNQQIAAGRGQLRDVANLGRSTAGNLHLGQSFDPFQYSADADTAFNSWLSSLDQNLRAAAPGNLFNTTGLANIAGTAQGQQNLKFDPRALSGLAEDDTDSDTDDDRTKESVF